MQARTGKIGLQAFLFERRVPDVTILLYYCGIAPETAAHLVLDCPELQGVCRVLQLQQYPRALRIYQDFVQAIVRL